MQLNNKNYVSLTDCMQCNQLFYVYINYIYYTVNSLISQNINIILFNYILVYNILRNLKFIIIYIIIILYIYIHSIINYQTVQIRYSIYNVYIYILYYYAYNSKYIFSQPKQYIKSTIHKIDESLNALIKSTKLVFNSRIKLIIILWGIISVLTACVITFYILLVGSTIYVFFNLDFFLLKLIALLFLFIYDSIIYLAYNFYFSIIISAIYLNYETIFYLFNEFFWDFTEGAYQMLYYSNEFLNLIFGIVNTLILPQTSLNPSEAIILNLYSAYLNVEEFFYFCSSSLLCSRGNLFCLDVQIFVLFDNYMNYKNFIFNNLGEFVLRGIEGTVFFLDFSCVDLLHLLRSSWFILFYIASINITKSVIIFTLVWLPVNFCIFLIFDYCFFLTVMFQHICQFFSYSAFFLVFFDWMSYCLGSFAWISFLFKWVFLNLLLIIYPSGGGTIGAGGYFLEYGWHSGLCTFLEIYLVVLVCVCVGVFNLSSGYSWIFWLGFDLLKSMYFYAIYIFYGLWFLVNQMIVFFFGGLYWVAVTISLSVANTVLSCVFNFLEYAWCVFDFFNFFFIFWYVVFDYHYLFSFIWMVWVAALQFVSSSVFFSTYTVYLGLWVVLIGSLFYYSSLLVADYSAATVLWRRWPVCVKNFFVFDNYLSVRRISVFAGMSQSYTVPSAYAGAGAKMRGLVKFDNFNSFGCFQPNFSAVTSSKFMFFTYFYCFSLARTAYVNMIGFVRGGGIGDFDPVLFVAGLNNFRKFICAATLVYSNRLLVRYVTRSSTILTGSSVFFATLQPGTRRFFSTFSVWVFVLSFSVLATLISENCYWLNEKSIFYLQKGQLTAVSYLNVYMSTSLRNNFGYNYIRENLRLAYNTRFLEEFAGSQIRFWGEFYKPKVLLHNYFILNPQDFLLANNAALLPKKIINKFGVDEVQDLLFKGRLDYFLKFRALWFFSYLNWLVYQYDIFFPPTTLQFFLPWRVFLQADYVFQFIGLGWILELVEGIFSWYRNMFFDFLPFLHELPAVNSIYLDFEFINFLLWGFRGNNFKFNPRVYYGQWVSNPILSLRWHYATYLKSRSWYTRRGVSVRELYYLTNPYKIFEDINDFPIFYNILFDDRQIRLDSLSRSRFLYKNFFRPKLLFGYKWNSGDFFSSGFNVFTTALSKNFYLESSFTDTTFKRQYNLFLSVSNAEKLINRANGLGSWSASGNMYDTFLRHFYYKYWAAKQAYSQKFLAYEKIQFFKKLRFSRVRSGIILNSDKSANFLRFDIYNQDYLNSQLAFFFKTFSVHSDVFFKKQGAKQYFDLGSFSLFSDFRSFKSVWASFFLDYGWTAIGEIFLTLFDYWSRLLFICIFRFFEFFSFFNLPFRVLVPFTLKLQVFNFLNYGAVNLELIAHAGEIQARSFIFFYTNSYKNHTGFLNHKFSYILGNSFL